MCLALAVLVFLLYSIFSRGFSAFQKTTILLEINYDQEVLKLTPDSTEQEIEKGKFFKVKKNALNNVFENLSKSDAKLIKKLFSTNIDNEIKNYFLNNPSVLNTKQKLWVTAHSNVDQMLKGNASRDVPEDRRKLNDIQLSFIDQLIQENRIQKEFNNFFFTRADSRHPEIPGSAAGKITFLIVSALLAPIPRDPSLKLCGTEFMTSSDKEEMKGIIITPITKPAAKALVGEASIPID